MQALYYKFIKIFYGDGVGNVDVTRFIRVKKFFKKVEICRLKCDMSVVFLVFHVLKNVIRTI